MSSHWVPKKSGYIHGIIVGRGVSAPTLPPPPFYFHPPPLLGIPPSPPTKLSIPPPLYNIKFSIHDTTRVVLLVTNLNGLPHSLLSYGHLIPGERACTGRTCLIKKFFEGPSKGRYIPWAVPEDSGYWLNGVLRGWSANG